MIENINKLIQSVNSGAGISAEELKQKYMTAQMNYEIAPVKLGQAKADYFTFLKGPNGYAKMQNEEKTELVEKNIEEMTKTFDKNYEMANESKQLLVTLVNNTNKMKELNDEYIHKNDKLKMKIEKMKNQVFTNDRKSFYNSQKIDGLTHWSTVGRWIYYIFLLVYIVYALSSYIVTKKLSMFHLFVILFLIFYPYIMLSVTNRWHK